jgi:hypothetical protein
MIRLSGYHPAEFEHYPQPDQDCFAIAETKNRPSEKSDHGGFIIIYILCLASNGPLKKFSISSPIKKATFLPKPQCKNHLIFTH